MLSIEFCQRAVKARKDMGLTQREAAGRMGISPSGLAQIELGTANPSVRVIISMAKVYHVTTDWLLLGGDISAEKADEQMFFSLKEHERAALADFIVRMKRG